MDNVDTDNGENDIVPFINGLNDYYLKNLSDRIKTVLTAKAKDGQYLAGDCPYGYMRDPENHTHLVVDEYASDVVKKIYEMRLAGLGFSKIASEKAQKVNQTQTDKYGRHSAAQISLFSKLLVCSDCGRNLMSKSSKRTNRYGNIYRYTFYQCETYRKSGCSVCTKHSIPNSTLKKIILDDIRSHADRIKLNEKTMIKMLQEQLHDISNKRNCTKRIRDLEQKLYKIEIHTAKLYEDRCDGIIAENRFTEMIADLESKRKVIQTELDNFKSAEINKLKKLNDIQNWISLIKENSSIEDLDRKTLETLIDKIEVGENEIVDGKKRQDIKIYYKFIGFIQ